MVRYEDKERGWWVEIAGAADLSMQELFTVLSSIADGWPVLGEVVRAIQLKDRHDDDLALDFANPDGWMILSSRQRHWITDMVRQAALDEVASGEA